MKYKVLSCIKKYNMLKPGAKVLVALSGGSDSTALLHVLLSLKDDLDIDIEAAHINHCLRGDDADSDEEFVRRMCDKYGVKLHVLKADVSSVAEKYGMTVEEAGRKVRYEFFDKVCQDGYIATAHNLNDRIETFLFNFSRGATLNGLCSIPPVRGNIIRPLIDCSKDEILDYCEKNCLEYVTDKTNSDVVYARNRIRHNVISELKKINPGFESAARKCIDSLNADRDYLKDVAEEAFEKCAVPGGYDLELINSYPLPVRNRVVSSVLENENISDYSNKMIADISSAAEIYCNEGRGMKIQLSGAKFARTRNGILEFPGEKGNVEDTVELKEGENFFGDYIITVSYNTDDIIISQNINSELSVFIGDNDNIIGRLISRKRLPGDKITLPNASISKSLRKIQNEKGIPPEIRDAVPVIADSEGLLCAFGCGLTKRFKVTGETVNKIKIEIRKKTM